MIKREIFGPDEIIEEDGADLKEIVGRLEQLRIGEYWSKSIPTNRQPMNPNNLVRYVEMLHEAGLDIGRGGASFGFKMPLPREKTPVRELWIFRRS